MTPNTPPKPGGTWRLIQVLSEHGPAIPTMINTGNICGIYTYYTTYIYLRIR